MKMMKKLLAVVALVVLFAMPAFADTVVRTYSYGGHTYTVTITYTEYNNNGRIDTLREVRSITNIQVTIS